MKLCRIIFFFLVPVTRSMLSFEESKFLLQFSEKLLVKQCFLVTNRKLNALSTTKLLSKHNILSTFMFLNYIPKHGLPPTNCKSLFLIKTSEVADVYSIIRYSRTNIHRLPIWLIFTESLESVLSVNLYFDYETYVVITEGSVFKIYDFYNLGNKKVISDAGEWETTIGLTLPQPNAFLRKNNLRGMLMHRVLVSNDTKVLIYHNEIIDELSGILNYTYLCEAPSDHNTYFISNHATELSTQYTPNRNVGPTLLTPLVAFIKETNNPLEYYFIKPFDLNVWSCIGGFLIVSSLCFLIIFLLSAKEKPMAEIVEHILIPLTTFSNQDSSTVTEENDYQRFAMAMTRIMGLAVIPSYAAVIISFITIKDPFIPFTNLQEMVEKQNYRLVAPLDDRRRTYFFYTANTFTIMVRDKYMIPYKESPANISEGVKWICNNQSLVLFFSMGNKEEINSPCPLRRIQYPISNERKYMATSIYPEYTKLLRKTMTVFVTSGILDRMSKTITVTIKVHDTNVDNDDSEAVSLDLVDQLFLIICLGIAAALVLIIAEIISDKVIKFKKKRNKP